MGNLDHLYHQQAERIPARSDEAELADEEVVHIGSAVATAPTRSHGAAALDLVYQAAEVINGIEDRASETEKTLFQKLELAQKRIEELEKDLQSARQCLAEMRVKLKESEEASSIDQSRLEAAEKKMCDLEMRARTAEAQAKNNSHTLARIEEAIRTQILEKRLPTNKLTLTA
jgi:Mg2+ and Co2+ transporter CorA